MDKEKKRDLLTHAIGGVGGGATIAAINLPFDLYTNPLKSKTPTEIKELYGASEGKKGFEKAYFSKRMKELLGPEQQWKTGIRTLKWDFLRKMIGWGVAFGTAGLIYATLKPQKDLLKKTASIEAIATLFENSKK